MVNLMNYIEAIVYIDSFGSFGIKPGFERIEYLLAELGDPQKKIKYIHVTGTNGKGSVCSMLESMLAQKYSVGKFTSPHLVKYNERFCLNKKEITDTELADLVTKVSKVVEKIPQDLIPTQFEVLTAMAFLFFAEQKPDYVILEVGMGGTLDSTNIIDTAVCSIITNVAMDHMDKCGDNLVEIAKHKAGIIKRGVPVVTAACEEALQVIRERSGVMEAPLFVYSCDFDYVNASLGHLANGCYVQKFTFVMGATSVNLEIGMLGSHQLQNASLAIATIIILEKNHAKELLIGIAQARWQGRIEIVARDPVIVLDGAHNVDGAMVLRKSLDELFSNKNICFILGFMQDKDIKGIVDVLVRDCDQVISVVADYDYTRSATPEYIDNASRRVFIHANTHFEALEQAKKLVGSEGVICIAGSLYLIGKIKKNLLE